MKQITFFLIFMLSTACAAVVPVQPVKIEGTAMVPTLKDGDKAIFDRGFDKLESFSHKEAQEAQETQEVITSRS